MIGIFGGTFDPIHYGHLRTALEVQEQLDLREVRFIPASVPPHRGQPLATAAHRLAMVQRAVAGQPGFVVDERELRREGPSFMVDTLASLREELGEESLCLIIGMDALLGLEHWDRWQRLLELAHLVVMGRPGNRLPATGAVADMIRTRETAATAMLHSKPSGCVYFAPVTELAISATAIRGQLADGHNPRFCLPDSVLDYIMDKGLYR